MGSRAGIRDTSWHGAHQRPLQCVERMLRGTDPSSATSSLDGIRYRKLERDTRTILAAHPLSTALCSSGLVYACVY